MSNSLTDPLTYDAENVIFEDIIEKTIPGQSSKYYNIGIKTRTASGKPGNLILRFDRSSSFGISNTYGTTLSVQLYDRDGPTERQRKTVELINEIVERAKDYLVKNSKALMNVTKKPTLSKESLEDLTPIKLPLNKETMTVDDSKSPIINLKLLTRGGKKAEETADNVAIEPKILTKFYSEDEVDKDGELLEVNPMDYLNKRCFVTCAVKVDGIFFGSAIKKLQLKLYECNIKGLESKTRRLLADIDTPSRPPRPTPNMETEIKDDFADTQTEWEETSTPLYEEKKTSESEEEEEKPVPVVVSRKKGGKK
jgi:hypothetical protein